jgi:hypothetical protein
MTAWANFKKKAHALREDPNGLMQHSYVRRSRCPFVGMTPTTSDSSFCVVLSLLAVSQ